MSLDKSEIKCSVIHQVGVAIEDSLEQAKRDVAVAQGANAGLVQIVKKIEGLSVHVDKDLDEGKYEDVGPLEVTKMIKHYLQRAVVVIESDARSFEQRRLMSEGRVSAFKQNVTMTKKLYDVESRKAEVLRQAEVEEDSESSSGSNGRLQRVVGVHPGTTVKQRRIIEEQQSSLTGEASPTPKVKVRRLASNGNNT